MYVCNSSNNGPKLQIQQACFHGDGRLHITVLARETTPPIVLASCRIVIGPCLAPGPGHPTRSIIIKGLRVGTRDAVGEFRRGERPRVSWTWDGVVCLCLPDAKRRCQPSPLISWLIIYSIRRTGQLQRWNRSGLPRAVLLDSRPSRFISGRTGARHSTASSDSSASLQRTHVGNPVSTSISVIPCRALAPPWLYDVVHRLSHPLRCLERPAQPRLGKPETLTPPLVLLFIPPCHRARLRSTSFFVPLLL